MHRRRSLLLASVAIVIAIEVGAGAPAAAAGPALPQRNLLVEARVVEHASNARQGLGAAGGVVVGTGGSTTTAGSLTLRAGSGSASSEQLQGVLVLNGGRATLRLAQLVPLRSVEWVWTPRGAGVAERTIWVDLGRGIEVRPAWAGGTAPVLLELALEAADAAATDPALAPRLAARTQVAAVIGEWLPVARIAEGASRSATTAGTGGVTVATAGTRVERSVEVRVSLP